MPKRKVEEPPPSDDEASGSGSEEDESSGSDGSSEGSSGASSGSDSDSLPDASEDGPSSEDDEDGEAYKEITVDFEFMGPKEKDFLGLRALLQTYLDGTPYNVSQLVDLIIKQDNVGSVVKTSEEDDPIAVMTVLSTRQHAGQECMKEIRAFLVSKCDGADSKAKVAAAWDAKDTALLLNERLINCPPKIAPPLMQTLTEEIEDASVEDSHFKFGRYLVFTRVYADDDAPAPADAAGPSSSAPPSKKQKADKKPAKAEKKSAAPTIVYVRPEDEFLHHHASWSFTFPIENRPVAKDELRPLRLVMAVDASKIPIAREELDTVVGNAMAGDE